MEFSRYAVYVTLPRGPLQAFGAAWLGWDADRGCEVAPPDVGGLPAPAHEITARPRKYGLHGTIKPPFRLAEGMSAQTLQSAFASFCAASAPVTLEGLHLSRIGGFLALTPVGATASLAALAAQTVEALDMFRAPPSPDELARRRASRLSPRQAALLDRWGYPYVMEEFRFHITLTGPLRPPQAEAVAQALRPHLTPRLPAPFTVDALTLCGEAPDGRFHEIHRCALIG